jgi:hypothetical protein
MWITPLATKIAWYDESMKPKKAKATAHVRLYPSTLKQLKLRAIRMGVTVAKLVDSLEKITRFEKHS